MPDPTALRVAVADVSGRIWLLQLGLSAEHAKAKAPAAQSNSDLFFADEESPVDLEADKSREASRPQGRSQGSLQPTGTASPFTADVLASASPSSPTPLPTMKLACTAATAAATIRGKPQRKFDSFSATRAVAGLVAYAVALTVAIHTASITYNFQACFNCSLLDQSG